MGGRIDQGGGRPNFLFRNKIGSQNAWLGTSAWQRKKTVNRMPWEPGVTVEVGVSKMVRAKVQSRNVQLCGQSRWCLGWLMQHVLRR